MLSTVRRLFIPKSEPLTSAGAEEFPGAAEHDHEIAAATSRHDQAQEAAETQREAQDVLTAAVMEAKSAFEAEANPTDAHYEAFAASEREHAKGAVFLARAVKLAGAAQSELESAVEARKQALLAHHEALANVGNCGKRVDEIWDRRGVAAVEQLAAAIAEISAEIDTSERAAHRASELIGGSKQSRLETGELERMGRRVNELRMISAHIRRRFRLELGAKLDGVGGLSRWIDQ